MHFLKANEVYTRPLTRPRAAVKVRLEGKDTLVICEPEDDEHPSIVVVKMDTEFAALPERMKVVGPDGKVVKPSKGKKFYVTVETFDPFHAVMEASDEEDL